MTVSPIQIPNYDDAVRAYLERHGRPSFVQAYLCDVNGLPRGKTLPGNDLEQLAQGRLRLPLSTYVANIFGYETTDVGIGLEVGDPDAVAVPVVQTLGHASWLPEPTAQVVVELVDGQGQVLAISPRQQLQRVVSQCMERGLRPTVAMELEFYLLQRRATADEAPRPPSWVRGARNFDIQTAPEGRAFLEQVIACAADLGIKTGAQSTEFGAGQFEINFAHTNDVMFAADTAFQFRKIVRGVAERHGLEATFMAKPYANEPGSGCHMHVSLYDQAEQNVFAQGATEERSLYGYTLGSKLRAALWGVLSTAQDVQAILAPHGNSYRRFGVGSFAPAKASWSYDHRGAGVRLPAITGDNARLEHRISGADVNPYLGLAAVLGGILHGLDHHKEQGLPPALDCDLQEEPTSSSPSMVMGDAYDLSNHWITAIERYEQSQMVRNCFSARNQEIYATLRRQEEATMAAEIAPFEYRTYLARM